MDTVAQDLLELNKFDFLDYCEKCRRYYNKFNDVPNDESKWMLNFIDDSENKYHKMIKLYCYQTWLYFIGIIRNDFNNILNSSPGDNIIMKYDVVDEFLYYLKKQNIISIMQNKIYNNALFGMKTSWNSKTQNEIKFIDCDYIAIVYLSFIKQLAKNIDTYNTSKFVIFKKDIIDKAFDIIKKSLDNILINDLNKIIMDYVASGSDVVYI